MSILVLTTNVLNWKIHTSTHYMNSKLIYVVVNFLSQVIFVFLLFLGMVMYANEFETKEKLKITRDKKLTTTYT